MIYTKTTVDGLLLSPFPNILNLPNKDLPNKMSSLISTMVSTTVLVKSWKYFRFAILPFKI